MFWFFSLPIFNQILPKVEEPHLDLISHQDLSLNPLLRGAPGRVLAETGEKEEEEKEEINSKSQEWLYHCQVYLKKLSCLIEKGFEKSGKVVVWSITQDMLEPQLHEDELPNSSCLEIILGTIHWSL